jgi:hypothetical protein
VIVGSDRHLRETLKWDPTVGERCEQFD